MTAFTRPKPLFILLAALAIGAAILWAIGRPPICSCGTVELWGEVGPKQSQMLADWYSPSHVIHGFLFYALLRWLWPRAPIEKRFGIPVVTSTAKTPPASGCDATDGVGRLVLVQNKKKVTLFACSTGGIWVKL